MGLSRGQVSSHSQWSQVRKRGQQQSRSALGLLEGNAVQEIHE
jgi:hypothetical protein